MLIAVVKSALRWGTKERKQEVERKVTQMFSNEKNFMGKLTYFLETFNTA